MNVHEGTRRFEIAMRAEAARVHDALRNALMIEMEDFFAEMKILEQRRAARARLQRVLIVGNGNALLRRKRVLPFGNKLMRFAGRRLWTFIARHGPRRRFVRLRLVRPAFGGGHFIRVSALGFADIRILRKGGLSDQNPALRRLSPRATVLGLNLRRQI